jgi:hypothetical protein
MRSLNFPIFLIGAAVLLGSCAPANDLGKGLTISVSGGAVALNKSNTSSCKDLTAAKPTSAVPATSVGPYYARWGSFGLQWQNVDLDILSIDVMTVTFDSDQINGGAPQVITVDSSEIAALLGVTSIASITPIAAPPAGQPANSVTFNSNDPSRGKASNAFAACGFAIGGIAVADNPPNFTARVTVEIHGTRTHNTTASNGSTTSESFPVRKKIVIKAQGISGT